MAARCGRCVKGVCDALVRDVDFTQRGTGHGAWRVECVRARWNGRWECMATPADKPTGLDLGYDVRAASEPLRVRVQSHG